MKISAFRICGTLKFLLPGLYFAGAAVIWFYFAGANPDGLANIWIVIYTFPIVAVGTYLLNQQFPYMPGSYYTAHALYFWPSVIFLAFILFLTLHGLQKLFRPRADDHHP